MIVSSSGCPIHQRPNVMSKFVEARGRSSLSCGLQVFGRKGVASVAGDGLGSFSGYGTGYATASMHSRRTPPGLASEFQKENVSDAPRSCRQAFSHALSSSRRGQSRLLESGSKLRGPGVSAGNSGVGCRCARVVAADHPGRGYRSCSQPLGGAAFRRWCETSS